MTYDPYELIEKYRHHGALIDTNLLLVYLVGCCGEHLLSQCSTTGQYEEEFEDIKVLVELFDKVHTTPNILTELSNLGNMELGGQFLEKLKLFVESADEQFCSRRDAVGDRAFGWLGLTDSALVQLGKSFLVVTTDARLYVRLSELGSPVVNYNHLRKFSTRQ